MANKDIVAKKVTLSFDVGTKNLAYCLIRDEDEHIIDWNVMDISAATYDRQCQRMIDALDLIDYSVGYPDSIKQSIVVVIEKQMARNPRMRVISGQLQMYFALEKRACEQNNDNVFIQKVIYYSPKFKLKCYTFREGDKSIITKKYSTPYAFRKDLGKQHCNIIINREKDGKLIQDKKWIDHYNKNKKKADDLADSFLQGLAYLRGI